MAGARDGSSLTGERYGPAVASSLTPIGVWVVLLASSAVAWAWTVFQARSMAGMGDMGGMRDMALAPSPAGPFLAAWIVMMVAMMFPSVAPTVTAFTAVGRDRGHAGQRAAPAWVFLVGYLAIWGLFGAGAYVLSLIVPDVRMAAPGLRASSPLIGGLILMLAGIYQWSPLKRSCLEHCRAPRAFFAHEWREGVAGAFRSGVAHGTRCVGCSAGWMVVLFAVGLMNLGWMAVLAAVIFAEIVGPFESVIGRLAGAGLLIAGVATATTPWLGRFPA
jgi:predicted metal-binding membrane protein